MPEPSSAQFYLDPPRPEGVILYAGPVMLKGWAVGSGGDMITDLRVRLGTKIYPVVYGNPRPDLARYFQRREPFLLAGFEVELLLAAGENRVEFEMCTLAGCWLPLAVSVLVATPAQPVEIPAQSAVVKPHEFARALRLVLQRAVTEPLREAAAAVVAPLPIPFITRYAALPFHGHLHQPPLLQRADFGRLIVEGWLFHETEKIRRVAATVDLQAWSILELGGDLPYVAGLFPQFPNAHGCRIEGYVDVPAQLTQPVSVRVYAELADGSWHLCHVQRTFVYDGESNKAPYGRFSPVRFAQAVFALRAASLRRGFQVPTDKWFLRALREVWTEYRARAAQTSRPTRSLPPPGSQPPPKHVVLATHNLNFEGAPLFLAEYAEYLASHGSRLHVVSAGEGPLRARFEALHAGVRIVDVKPLQQSRDAGELRAALRGLAATVDLASADLVVANTLSAYWAVHLAHAAGKPSLLYIHESTTPEAFYHGQMASETLPLVKRTFSLATHLSFLTQATRRYYEPSLPRANHSINPGWIDVARLTQLQADHPRPQLREALGLSPGQRLVVNLGTICDRKGQHIFARAVDLLWCREPALAAGCEFLMIGGRHTPFDQTLDELLVHLDRPNLRAVPETASPFRYYGAADLFVCSSYEESFPRVILEAMAFRLPIVSTGVHGVPEMARAGQEALLVPPGDPVALATAMAEMLSQPDRAQKLAAQAALRVAAEFDSRLLLPRHAALAGAVAAGKFSA
ncbi:MAG: glycosyltransferase family 4 protein [Opitutae bacterium]|nr:glycosyltransferase family 4 protein [Opitutae bacterium]